jgi:hypothetical protein
MRDEEDAYLIGADANIDVAFLTDDFLGLAIINLSPQPSTFYALMSALKGAAGFAHDPAWQRHPFPRPISHPATTPVKNGEFVYKRVRGMEHLNQSYFFRRRER